MHKSFQKTSGLRPEHAWLCGLCFQSADFSLLDPVLGPAAGFEYDIKMLSVLFYQAAITYLTFMISNACSQPFTFF